MERKRCLLLAVVSLLLVGFASAQTFRGSIVGTVTDSSGAVVSGAAVKARNVDTGLERTANTTPDGSYNIPELPIGTYDVTITQSGFETAITKGVAVSVAAQSRIDVALKPGQVSQQVEVTEEVPLVDTTTTDIGGSLTAKTIENIPVNGRDYTKLIYLSPGVAGSPDQISDSPGSFGEFSMNGSRGRSNNYLLDGTDMNDGYRNDPAINEAGVFGDPATILPIDAVAELHVLSNYQAEYGRNSGAVVNIVTKSGTNNWHGSAIEYWRSGQLGARNYFNFDNQPKNPFLNNQFGGSLGGPIVKDKAFFFVDYEGQRESGAQSALSCVPDQAAIAQAEATAAQNGVPLSQPMLNLLARNPWPQPNIGGATTTVNGCNQPNLATATRFSNDIDSVISKVDYNPNTNNSITGRYYFGNSNQSFPFAQLASGLLPGFNTVTPTRVQLVAISWVKVINPSQVNEARFGWNRFAEGFFPQDQAFNPATIGLDTGVNSYNGGLPLISVGSFSKLGATASVPRQRVDTNWQALDDFSWKIGRHELKVGYEYRRTTIAIIQDSNFRGKLNFSDLVGFVEGLSSGGSQASGYTKRHEYQNNNGLYFQDSFRWTPRLTLNYGLRWDYYGVAGEKNDFFYRLIPANGGTLVQVGGPGGPSKLYNPDWKNFAPRFGFAWDVTGKGTTVLRGGYGIFFDAFSQDMFLGHIPYNCTFCPGPAYTGVGGAPITFFSATKAPIAEGSPVYVNPSPLGSFFGIDPNIRTPYVQNYNINLQQAFGNKVTMELGYVGAKGTRLFRFRDINQPTQAQITAYDNSCPLGGVAPNCPIAGFDTGSNVPRTNYPNFFYFNQEESSAFSTYNALQGTLRTQAWHGLSMQANYVWSHSIDNASDLEDFIPNASQPNNSFNLAPERGNSNFDIRQRFSFYFTYQFPGSTGRLKSGWGIDGTTTVQDGQPFSLNYNFYGDYSGSGEGFDRPDVVGPIQYGNTPFQFLNLSSFQVPCTFGNTTAISSIGDSNCLAGSRHFGNLQRNVLIGPPFKEVNFAVFKSTAITERLNLMLRAEFFNIFNHPNFANPELPNFIADPGVNGIAPNGRSIGYYGLTATGDVGIGNPFLGGGGPRGVQLAAKFTF
jgi:hypothetical protein